MSTVKRNANLDLLRATAIVVVAAYHLIQMSPVPQPKLMQVVVFGQYGVDLFFVLSGWLIGRLYWKEHSHFGNVDLLRFWARRWIRTIPPYLVALSLAWLAVLAERAQPFDWGYLVFVQNYYPTTPFFSVSWSLCIEEHFYLLLPFLLVWAARSKRSVLWLFTVLVLIAPICRFFLSRDGAAVDFGYAYTATHLRMEGLLLGFLAAYIPTYMSSVMLLLQKRSSWLIGFSIAALATFAALPALWRYRLGLSVLALGLVALLVCFVGKNPGALASSRFVQWVAVTSYSIYLTHALIIHVARRVIGLAPSGYWPFYYPLGLILIMTGGFTFHLAVERTSISLRDHWVARRRSSEVVQSDRITVQAPNMLTEGPEISLIAAAAIDRQKV